MATKSKSCSTRILLFFLVSFAVQFVIENAFAASISLDSLPKATLLNATAKSTNELKGKIVLVDFWASWCEPCKESLPFYQELQKKNKDIEVILVNEDSDKKLGEDFLKEKQIHLASRYDAESALAKAWDMEALPMLFVFDKSGKFIKSFRGFTKAKEKLLLKSLDELK